MVVAVYPVIVCGSSVSCRGSRQSAVHHVFSSSVVVDNLQCIMSSVIVCESDL